ncbi:MAG: hypothetical protein IJR04_01875 [Bacteroidales bacterium]|nr:hypothetical protein [Bacteroidales bacterium]
MKNLKVLATTIAVATLLFTGCCKEQTSEVGYAKVKVHVDDFAFTQEEIGTKDVVPVADYNSVKAVTLAFYTSNGTEQYKVTQLKDDNTTYTTFGNFECSLPMGNYTMVVVAYKTQDDSPFVLTSPTQAAYTGAHMLETFATTQAVNVENTTGLTLNATVNRVVSMIKVVSTDGRTSNADSVRITMSAGSMSFNPTTGLALTNTGFTNTVGISANVGAASTSGSYLFLYTDEQTMDITIDVLDASGNSISHKVVNDVPMKRNRKTVLSGSLYSAGSNSGFSVNTTWLTEHTMSF